MQCGNQMFGLGLVASVAPLELECLDGRWPKSIKVRGAGVCDWHMELDHQESGVVCADF